MGASLYMGCASVETLAAFITGEHEGTTDATAGHKGSEQSGGELHGGAIGTGCHNLFDAGLAASSVLVRVNVPVVHVWVMCMTVLLSRMRVNMAVRFTSIPFGGMFMVVVCIMPMTVSVGQWFMYMRVFMAFTYVQPHAQCHEQRG